MRVDGWPDKTAKHMPLFLLRVFATFLIWFVDSRDMQFGGSARASKVCCWSSLIRRSAGSIISNVDWDRFPGSDQFGRDNIHLQLESQLTILSRVCGGSG